MTVEQVTHWKEVVHCFDSVLTWLRAWEKPDSHGPFGLLIINEDLPTFLSTLVSFSLADPPTFFDLGLVYIDSTSLFFWLLESLLAGTRSS